MIQHIHTYAPVRELNDRQILYRLSFQVPIGYPPLFDDAPERPTTNYVISSHSLPGFFPPETMVFPADANGEVLSSAELIGIRGYDHFDAMALLIRKYAR